jgi:dTDP-4-amino-4,6-dideoxygalactose transaminase
LEYYDISEDFKISENEIERHISENPKIKMLYIIHYFGFLHKNIEELSSVCKRKGIILVEDHAHSALSQGKENLSDIQIFSFRKIFSTADGGGLLVKEGGFEYDFPLKSKIAANIKGLVIAIKRIGSLYSPLFRRTVGGMIQKDISSLNEGSSKITPLPVSKFGKGIICSADLQQNALERRKQFKIWKSLMESTPFKCLFPDLEEGTVPVGYPVKVSNNTEVVEYFEKYNIFLKIHWSSLPKGTAETCPVSFKISRGSITLPIYPGLKTSDMKFIRDELLKCAIPV